MENETKGSGCIYIIIATICIALLVSCVGGGSETEYSRAGNEFDTWIN